MSDEKTLAYKSEDDRLKALAELPDEPPFGESNIEAWFDSMTEQREAIERAEIDPALEVGTDDAAQAQAPLENGDPPAKQETLNKGGEEAKSEVLKFEIDRSELPEELRDYDNAGEIIKQYGHARKYANSIDTRLTEINKENAILREKIGSVDALQAKIAEMETARVNLQKQVDSRQRQDLPIAEAQSHLNDLNASLSDLNQMADDDLVSVSAVRKTLKTAVGEIGSTVNALGQTRQDLDTYRAETSQTISGLESKLDSFLDKQNKVTQREEVSNRMRTMSDEIKNLQDTHPELKTSKPVFSVRGESSVESSVANFADRIAMIQSGSQNPNWNDRNKIVNAFLRDDPEILAFCSGNGVNPEQFGVDKQDIRSYETIANIDAHMRGEAIDEYSGQKRKVLNNVNNQPVNFPSYRSAYRHILDESGMTQAQIDAQRAEAEIKGQQSLETSLMDRAAAPKTLGKAGEASPDNIGEEISEQQATEIISTMDEEKMEFQARNGNRTLFNLYNKACGRLKLPPMGADTLWPTERQKQIA